MEAPDDRKSKFLPDPYFNESHFPDSKLQYVAWLDLMGTRSMMAYSFEIAATKLCKLHLFVAQQEDYDRFDIYPMNDGLFVTADSYKPLKRFLSNVFEDHAAVLTSDMGRDGWHIEHVPIPRAAIAYGEVYHAKDIRTSALADYRYASSIILGDPMVTAFNRESDASPFGIVADESVHEESGHVQWCDNDRLARILFLLFDEYVRACHDNPDLSYPETASDNHLALAREYLMN